MKKKRQSSRNAPPPPEKDAPDIGEFAVKVAMKLDKVLGKNDILGKKLRALIQHRDDIGYGGRKNLSIALCELLERVGDLCRMLPDAKLQAPPDNTTYSTEEAAEACGVHRVTLQRWLADGTRTDLPQASIQHGKHYKQRRWTEADIARLKRYAATNL